MRINTNNSQLIKMNSIQQWFQYKAHKSAFAAALTRFFLKTESAKAVGRGLVFPPLFSGPLHSYILRYFAISHNFGNT